MLASVAAVISMLVASVFTAGAQPAWTGVVTSASPDAGTPVKIVTDNASNVMALFTIGLGTGGMRVARFDGVARMWTAPVDLSPGYSPDIAMAPNGDAVIVWIDNVVGGGFVRTRRYSASADAWSAPSTIASGATFSLPHVAVDPAGNATAAWISFAGAGHTHVQAARYTAHSGVWSGGVNVAPLPGNNLRTGVGVVMDAAGQATAVFWGGTAAASATSASRSLAGATSWSSPVLLRASFGSMGPSMTVDPAGNVFATWISLESTGGIVAARYAAATNDWSDTVLAPLAQVYGGTVPQIVADDDGNATAVWAENVTVPIISRTYARATDTWSAQRTTFPGSPAQHGLAIDGAGTLTLAWSQFDTLSGEIVGVAARRALGQPWTTPVVLTERGSGISFAAASQAGDVTVLWSNLLSTRWAISGVAGLSPPTRLAITTARVVNRQAQVGAPLRISWSPPETGLPITGYRVQAGTGPGLSDLANIDVGLATHLDATVPLLRRVDIRILALSGMSVSAPSIEDGFLVFGVCEPPSAPTGLTRTVSGNVVTFGWQGVSDASSYVLEAGTGPGLANLVSTNLGSVTTFSAVAPPGTYFVRVRAANICFTGQPSNEVSFTIAGASVPPPPTLMAPVVTGSTVQLSWSGTPGASYTLLVRTTPGGAIIVSAPVGTANALSVPDVGAGTYYVSAVATIGGQTSAESNQIVVTVPEDR